MSAPQAVLDLTERFDRNREAYRSRREQATLRRQIYATYREIDRLVYELYGVMEEEIKIVEGNEGKVVV